MIKSNSEIKNLSYYGSISWANDILRVGTADCRDLDREPKSCTQEIIHIIHELSHYGYSWQSKILRYHYHLRLRNLSQLARASGQKLRVDREEHFC